MHNVPKWSDTLGHNGQTGHKWSDCDAARFLKCLTILGHYALKG